MSAKTGAGLDELRAALARAADGVEHVRADRPTRLYVDRSFTLRGIGTVVTGTLWSGTIGAGDELVLEPSGRPVRVRSVQVHDRDVERAEAGQRVAVSLPGRRAARGRARRRARRAGRVPGRRTGSTSCSTSSSRSRTARAFRSTSGRRTSPRGSSGSASAARSSGSPRRSSRRAATASSCAARRRSAAARCVDPAPPRHRDAERIDARRARGRRGDDPRARARRFAPARPRRRARRASSGRAVGLLRGLARRARARAARRGSRRPTRSIPGVSAPPDPWAADVLPLLPSSGAASKLYLPGAVATLGGREAEAAALERELAAAGVRATKVEDDELARFLEANGTLVRLGDGHAIGAGAYEVAKDALLAECRRPRVRSRSAASGISSASGGATRSSCSSGSTRTG